MYLQPSRGSLYPPEAVRRNSAEVRSTTGAGMPFVIFRLCLHQAPPKEHLQILEQTQLRGLRIGFLRRLQ